MEERNWGEKLFVKTKLKSEYNFNGILVSCY
jgi:hypothetical protein